MKLNNTSAVLSGALLLTMLSLTSARAQTTPDATATPPVTAPAPDATATPPANATPATPVPAGGDQTTSGGQNHSNRFRFGPAVGVYLPADGKTRDRFGDAWYSIGLGLGSINPVSEKGNLTLDLNLLYHGRDGNHAFFAPLGVGYRIALSDDTSVIPYAGVSADLNFSDITSNPDNIHNSFQVGAGGSVFLGANFGDSAFVEARYYELSDVSGFDLSGLGVDAGYRF